VSSSFIFYQCSPKLTEAIQNFGCLAVDTFWNGQLLDEDEEKWTEVIWTEAHIQATFDLEAQTKLDHLPKDLCLFLLQAGWEASNQKFGRLDVDGSFMGGIHFLLTGKRQLTHCDFLTKELHLGPSGNLGTRIILINGIRGGLQIDRGEGPDVNLLAPEDLQVTLESFAKILEDDFESRWKILQDLDKDTRYGPDYDDPQWAKLILANCRRYYRESKNKLKIIPDDEDPRWAEETIRSARESAQKYRQMLDRRHGLSLPEFFHGSEGPKKFIATELMPMFQTAHHSGCGILVVFCY
jgi:hypothetical protein